jgi:hypothetical protein
MLQQGQVSLNGSSGEHCFGELFLAQKPFYLYEKTSARSFGGVAHRAWHIPSMAQ